MTTTIKKRMTNSGEYLQKVIVWNISMLLTAHGLSQTALTEPLKMTRGGVSAKMKNKNTWSRGQIVPESWTESHPIDK